VRIQHTISGEFDQMDPLVFIHGAFRAKQANGEWPNS